MTAPRPEGLPVPQSAGTEIALRVVQVLDLPKRTDKDRIPVPYQPGEADWMRDGACRKEDPRLFDTSTNHGETSLNGSVVIAGKRMAKRAQVDRARRICRGCRVIGKCLAFILKYPQENGIWAALLPDEPPRTPGPPPRKRP